ncbi:MAG: hypothetical protein UZ05_CHB002000883 [Chlorobi bacterium OLB5]|nr:MAG: hypothetical protein UZ05_CHB002000883 [Chlorobi bacterium OLB5]
MNDNIKIIIPVILLFLLILSSCNPSGKKFQGKWSASGDIGDSTDVKSWYIEYIFEGNNYKMQGYPPISEEGTYEVIEEKGDSVLVYFNVINSKPESKDRKDWLLVKDSVLISGGLTLHKSQ